MIHAIVALALLAAALETLRARPRWPRPPAPGSRPLLGRRGLSPRERRWVDGGLALVVAANGVNVLQVDASTGAGMISLTLGIVGAVAMAIGVIRGPSARDWAMLREDVAAPR